MVFRKQRFGHNNFAWAERKQVGYTTAFIKTCKEIVLHPQKFFRKLHPAGNLKPDLLFAAIIGSIPPVIFFSLFLFFLSSGQDELWRLYTTINGIEFNSAGRGFLITILSPVQVVAGIFFLGGLMHLFLRITGWKRASFPGTVRALSYSTIAGLGALVPLAGGIIGTFWGLALQTIGIKTIHKLTTWKALVTIMLPPLLLGLTIFLLAIGVHGVIGAVTG